MLTSLRSSLLIVGLGTLACGGLAEAPGGGSGGTGSGGAGTGGTTSTGGVGTGGSVLGLCEVDDDCLAVLDTSAPCFSLGCTNPIAASVNDSVGDPCLVPWEKRSEGIPVGCRSDAGGVDCPAYCAAPLLCATALCESGTCVLKSGNDVASCGYSCDAATQAMQTTVSQAAACDPFASVPQCSGATTVPDVCGCPQIMNDAAPELSKVAQQARDQWASLCPAPPCVPECQVPTGGACASSGQGGDASVCVAKF